MKQLPWTAFPALLIAVTSNAQTGLRFTPGLRMAETFLSTPATASEVPPTRAVSSLLPDSPGVRLIQQQQQGNTWEPVPCPALLQSHTSAPEAASAAEARHPCAPVENPYKRFLDNGKPIPLSPRQKGYLAFHDVIDPFNLLTIVANSAVTVAIDSHNAYGPGMKGFGRSIGYSFSQDATGEVIGTFGICSLLHEDPHYHRMPTGTPFNRVVHAISRTVIAQHDNGTPMLNYEVLLTYPASAEISNLYVPGVNGNGPSTVTRILIGLATDPINNLVTEFLPDFAKRFHIRVVFLQQIINQVASGQAGSP